MHLFQGESANAVWQSAMLEFRDGGTVQQQSGRNGSTRELLHATFSIRNPRDRWITARLPALNPAFAIAEVVWIVCGRQDSGFLNYWNPKLPEFAGYGEQYPGAYGFRLRRHFELDQLERAYLALKNNPDGRQVVLQIWDTKTDLPDEHGTPAHPNVPCNLSALLKVRGGKLEWMQINRSNDMFLGVPYNFIQFTSIQEILAGWLGVELGTYNHLSDSLHIYDENTKRLSVDAKVVIEPNLDVLSLPKEESDIAFSELNNRLDAMTKADLSETQLEQLCFTMVLNSSFANLLLVNGAEAARQRGWVNIANNLIATCTNPALIQVWNRWSARVHYK